MANPLYMLGGTVFAAASSGLLTPIKEKVRQGVMGDTPIWHPGVSDILQAYNAGLLNWSVTRGALLSQGIDWSPDPTFGLDVPEGVFQRIEWNAVQKLGQSVPGVEQAVRAWSCGFINDREYLELAQRAGADTEKWAKAWRIYEPQLPVGSIQTLLNRAIIDDGQANQLLRKNGFSSPSYRDWLIKLREQIPAVSDLIQMTVKESFNPGLGNFMHIYDETPTEATRWFEAQGVLGGPGFEIVSDGNKRQATWLDMYWSAHWRPISPGQAYEMYHRLRPDRIADYQAMGLKVEPFTLDDVKKWLRIQDFPPYVRDSLAAISFKTLGVREIRSGLQFGVLKKEQAIQRFQDQGITRKDAEIQTDITLARIQDMADRPLKSFREREARKHVDGVVTGYSDGLLTRQQAVKILGDTRLDKDVIDLALNNAELEIKLAMVKEYISGTKKDYLSGVVSKTEAQAIMLGIGITSARISQHFAVWDTLLSRRRKIATSSQVLKWVREGLLDAANARIRLANLGWSDPDSVLMLAEVQQAVNRENARKQTAVFKSKRQQAKDLQRQLHEQQRAMTAGQIELRRLTPRSTLLKWLKLCVIGPKFFRKRMMAMGYPPAAIDSYIQQTEKDRGKKSCTYPTTDEQTAANGTIVSPAK